MSSARLASCRKHIHHPGCWLLLLATISLPLPALADCAFSSGSVTNVTFNAGNLTMTPSTPVGTVLWTSDTANPANPPELVCDGNTNGGTVNTIAPSTPVGGDDTLLPTGIPGISYRLLHPDASTPLELYPNYRTGSGIFSVPTNLQLVYTGPYLPSNNSTLTGELSRWQVDICDNPRFRRGNYRDCRNGTVAPRPVEIFNINANITIQIPTCTVSTASANELVTLPTIGTQPLAGLGSWAGQTHFSLQLTQCADALDVYVTLNTATPEGTPGVIAPTTGTGYATGVGVQLLKADAATPVTFGTPLLTGSTQGSNSSYAIDLFARYYQTAATVTPGTVKAIATFTIGYQ